MAVGWLLKQFAPPPINTRSSDRSFDLWLLTARFLFQKDLKKVEVNLA